MVDEMEDEENSQEETKEAEKASAFKDLNLMDHKSAITILIQASYAAQSAGVLTVRDSIMVGAAIEVLTGNPV